MRHRAWLRRLRTLALTMCALAVASPASASAANRPTCRWSVS